MEGQRETSAGRQARWKLDQLDALRGIAIFGVLVVHTIAAAPFAVSLNRPVLKVVLSGQRGVQLFYILSAFTLAMSNERHRSELYPTRNFFVRRFFRIAPMFYIALLLTRLFDPVHAGDWITSVLAGAFLNGFHWRAINDGVVGGWSVADEAIFYALLPLLLLFIRTAKSAAITFVAVALVSVSLAPRLSAIWPEHAQYFEFHSMIAELPIFLSGLLLFYVWKELVAQPEPHRSLSIFLLSAAFLLYLRQLPFSNSQLLPESLALVLLTLALLLCPWKLLVNRATIFLGRISFSLYLLHSMIYLRLGRRLHAAAPNLDGPRFVFLMLFIGCAVSVPISAITFRFVEKPGTRMGERLIVWLEGHRARKLNRANLHGDEVAF